MLSLADTQVLCTATIPACPGIGPLRLVNDHFGEREGSARESVHNIVEPFSLDINIQTHFDTGKCNLTAGDGVTIEMIEINGENRTTKIRARVYATEACFQSDYICSTVDIVVAYAMGNRIGETRDRSCCLS